MAAVILAITAGFAGACTEPPPPADEGPPPVQAAPDSVRDQVLAVVEQYYADLSNGEWEFVRGHFWPGATLTTIWTPPGEPGDRVVNTSIESFIEQVPQGPGSRAIFSESMTSAHVRGTTEIAQVWTTYDARFGDPGDIQEWTGIDAFTLLRFEGRWRITSMTYVAIDGGPQ